MSLKSYGTLANDGEVVESPTNQLRGHKEHTGMSREENKSHHCIFTLHHEVHMTQHCNRAEF